MTKATSAAQIIKKIGNDKLSLFKGEGYWFFSYDDFAARTIYETRSVYVMYLNQMSLQEWIDEGNDFIRVVKQLNEGK